MNPESYLCPSFGKTTVPSYIVKDQLEKELIKVREEIVKLQTTEKLLLERIQCCSEEGIPEGKIITLKGDANKSISTYSPPKEMNKTNE